jgi:hypothetical protein
MDLFQNHASAESAGIPPRAQRKKNKHHPSKAAPGRSSSGNRGPCTRSFYFSMSISGYFRRTAVTTAACSGFPLDRARASRA